MTAPVVADVPTPEQGVQVATAWIELLAAGRAMNTSQDWARYARLLRRRIERLDDATVRLLLFRAVYEATDDVARQMEQVVW